MLPIDSPWVVWRSTVKVKCHQNLVTFRGIITHISTKLRYINFTALTKYYKYMMMMMIAIVDATDRRNSCRDRCSDVFWPYGGLRSGQEQAAGEKSPQSNFVRVHSDGTCIWWPLFEQSESHCPIDVTWYPFDDQHCNLSFESWKYNSEVLMITAKHLPELVEHYNVNEEWSLLGHPSSEFSIYSVVNIYSVTMIR